MKIPITWKLIFLVTAFIGQLFLISTSFADEPLMQKNVFILNSAFQPTAVIIPVGGTVIWTNKDSSSHTVISNNKMEALKSEQLATDESYRHTFTRPGIFVYFCSNHPKMIGQVIVQQVNSKKLAY